MICQGDDRRRPRGVTRQAVLPHPSQHDRFTHALLAPYRPPACPPSATCPPERGHVELHGHSRLAADPSARRWLSPLDETRRRARAVESGGSGAGCRRDARAHGPDPRRGRAAPDHRARPRVSCSPIPCVMPPLRTSAPATTPTGTRRVSPRWHPNRTWSRMGSWAAWGSPDQGWRAPAWDCSPTNFLGPLCRGTIEGVRGGSPSARWRAQHTHTRRVPCRGDHAPRAGGVPSGHAQCPLAAEPPAPRMVARRRPAPGTTEPSGCPHRPGCHYSIVFA